VKPGLSTDRRYAFELRGQAVVRRLDSPRSTRPRPNSANEPGSGTLAARYEWLSLSKAKPLLVSRTASNDSPLKKKLIYRFEL
jgi:hypothetical protein